MGEITKPKIKKNKLEAPSKLKILVTIVERSKASFYIDILEGFDVNLQTIIYGYGTASNEMLNLLGLVNNSKAVIFSIIKEERIKEVLNAYEDKYFKIRNGKGIAFTIPISSMIGISIYNFLCFSKGNR